MLLTVCSCFTNYPYCLFCSKNPSDSSELRRFHSKPLKHFLILHRRRTICSFFYLFVLFPWWFYTWKIWPVWALRCLFSQDQVLSYFVGKTVLTFKLSLKAIALKCVTDDSLPLPECMEENWLFRGCSGCQQLFHLHLPWVPTLCLPLDSQTIADASMTLKKE